MSAPLPATGLRLRLLRGGVSLSALECFLPRTLEQHVPLPMAATLRRQWQGLNLIQRSPNCQELRFCRIVRGRVDRSTLPKLPVRDGEVKLLNLALRPVMRADLLHVNFWAVDGWFFNLNASESLRPFRDRRELPVEAAEHSYRSNPVARDANSRELVTTSAVTCSSFRTAVRSVPTGNV